MNIPLSNKVKSDFKDFKRLDKYSTAQALLACAVTQSLSLIWRIIDKSIWHFEEEGLAKIHKNR